MENGETDRLTSETAIPVETPWVLVAGAAFGSLPLGRKSQLDIVQKIVVFYLAAVLVNELTLQYFRISLAGGSANISCSVIVMIPLALSVVLSRRRVSNFSEASAKKFLSSWYVTGAIIAGHMAVCAVLFTKFYGYGYEHNWAVLGNLCLYFLLFVFLWSRFDSAAFRRVIGVILLIFYVAAAMGCEFA